MLDAADRTLTADPAFYVTGGTLHAGAPSYVERSADRVLCDALHRGEFCYVLTSRQMGKSSLMVRTATRFRQEGVAVAILDLTAVGRNLSPEQWYEGLLGLAGSHLDLEDELEAFWLAHAHVGPLHRWLRALREVILPRCPGRVILFLDEIDVVRGLPFSADEFFAAIRECYNRRTDDPEFHRLTFCLMGVATPADLIQDVRLTPFNIGRRIELTDFTEGEAAPLARGLADERAGKVLLERVLYWTGGHPYLTQRLCQAVATARATDRAEVDRLCQELFLSPRAQERDDNLLFVRDRLLHSEQGAAALLDLYAQVRRGRRVRDEETSRLVGALRLSGVTRARNGDLQVRNRIYARVFDREWIANHMPDAELRRQRAAYRRGLLRASAVAGVVLAVIGGLALSAVRAERRARQSAEARQTALIASRRLLYAAETNLAQQAWDTGNFQRARELVEAHGPQGSDPEDLRDFAWRYLWRLCEADAPSAIRGHTQTVNEVTFSPDGKTLASASDDGTVKLWDVASRRKVATLKAHTEAVACVAFSPDGRLLASSSGEASREDKSIRLWDVASRREVAILRGHQKWVGPVAFAPGGNLLASGSGDGTVRLWAVAGRRVTAVLKGHPGVVMSLAFSPDGRMLASAGAGDRTVILWDVTARRERRRITAGSNSMLWRVAFSPNGRTIATCSADQTVRLFDVTTGRQQGDPLLGHTGSVRCVAFSPDGRRLASSAIDATVRLWDVAARRQSAVLLGHSEGAQSVAFSPDGRTLAAGGFDGIVKLWDAMPQPEERVLAGHTDVVWSVAFAPDGKAVATASLDGSARLWQVASRRQTVLFMRPGTQLFATAFSPDGKMLALGGGAGTITSPPRRVALWLWDVASGKGISLPGHTGSVMAVAFSPDGRTLATGSEDKSVRLWDAASGKALAVLRGHKASVRGVAFSPDGKTLATGDFEGAIKLWDVAEKRLRADLEAHPPIVYSLAFSPDGRRLASGGFDKTVRLWDVAGGTPPVILRGHGSWVLGVAFSPDGRTLASGSMDKSVKLWNIIAQREVATFRLPDVCMAVAFSRDGRMLAAGAGRTARLWRAATLAETDAPGRHSPPPALR